MMGEGGSVRGRLRAALLAASTALAGACGAQGAGPASPPDDGWSALGNRVFEHLTQHDGLPHAIATSVTEGRDGALWAGTQDGVLRWDGSQFQVYNGSTGMHGLPSSYVRVVACDARGRIWVGTDGGGLVRYDEASDRFVSAAAGTFTSISPDRQGGVWAASTTGLVHVHPDGSVDKAWPRGGENPAALPDRAINAVLEDRRGTVWVGSQSGLVARFTDGRPGWHVHLPGLPRSDAGVDALYEDERGSLWIGTARHGIFVRDGRDGSVRQVHPESPAGDAIDTASGTAFADDGHGHVWIGTQTTGLLIADARTLLARPVAHSRLQRSDLPEKWIWGLFRDRSGHVWVASTAGLSRSLQEQDAVVTLLSADDAAWVDPYVFSIDVLPDGKVLMGQKSGVEEIDPAAGTMSAVRASRGASNVVAVAHAADSRSYLGARDGLFVKDVGSNTLRRVPLPRLGADQGVHALLVEGDVLWIGSAYAGLWRADAAHPAESMVQVLSPAQLQDAAIDVMLGDGRGGLWIGLDDGTLHWSPGRPLERVAATSRQADRVATNTLLLDRRQRLWIGANDGITVIDGAGTGRAAAVRRIDRSSGLASENIDTFLEDGQGRVWASTDEGIAVISEADFSLRVLHEKDGVPIDTYWVNSGAKGRHGELIFGGLGGLTVVRPDRLEKKTNPVSVVLSSVKVGATTLRPGQLGLPAHLDVPPEAHSFAVDFSAVDFAGANRVRYAYRLDGFDADWQDTDMAHRTAAYTNLAPAHYVLRVKAVDREGVWTAPLAIAVDVRPDWYQTWWFQVIKGAAALLAVVAIVALRGRYQRRRARELQRLVDLRTAELAAAQVRLEELAYSDALTALPNRRMFSDVVQRLAASCGRQGTSFALLLLDLDHFKQVNDTWGHDAGDALLVEVARRLRGLLRQSEFVARLGGDEFAILLSDESDRTGLEAFCQRLQECFRAPVMFKDVALQAPPSVGVALFPVDGTTQDELYKAADLALYEAKRAGRRTWRFASPPGASTFRAIAPAAARQP